MARFRCKNCGYEFTYDVKSRNLLWMVECPRCKSSWVEYVGPGLGEGAGGAKWEG
ncbi:MAG: hypothetical protein ACXQT2_04425 [Methanotrichaceae archaeon]